MEPPCDRQVTGIQAPFDPPLHPAGGFELSIGLALSNNSVASELCAGTLRSLHARFDVVAEQ